MRQAVVPAWLRWLAVVPAAILGWYAALSAGIAALSAVNGFCPPGDVVSGGCTAPWFPVATAAASCIGAALAAALVVLLPVLVAPARKAAVAVVALTCGSATAVYFAVQTGATAEFASAVVVGAICASRVIRTEARAESRYVT